MQAGGEMNSQSEVLLQKINNVLDTANCIGVEAIVKVHIVPATSGNSGDGASTAKAPDVDPTYRDSRRVQSWEFVKGPTPIMKRSP